MMKCLPGLKFPCLMSLLAILVLGMSLPAPATSPAPLILKISLFTPAGIPYVQANGWILQEIEKRSQGRIKFEYYYSGSLLPAKETMAGLKTGVADMGIASGAYEPGKLPILTILSLPMAGARFFSSAMATADLMELPEAKAELDKYNTQFASFWQNTSYGLWSIKPIKTLADLKGKKIRAVGEQATFIKELGGVPVSMVVTETYNALQRGTVDGTLANPIFAFDYKFNEVCPYYNSMMFGNVGYVLAINKDSWKKIPPDIQKMFVDLREEAAKIGHDIYETAGWKNIEEAQAKGKITIFKPSEEDVARARKVAQDTVWKDWVEKTNKKGLPAQKILEAYLQALDKWEARSPFKKPIYVR